MTDPQTVLVMFGAALLTGAGLFALLRGGRGRPVPPVAAPARIGEAQAFEALPLPAWREAADGSLLAANAAYRALAADHGGAERSALFDLPAAPAASLRRSPAGKAGGPWFDCLATPLPAGGRVCAALPADAVLSAEQTLHRFLQTLGQTFAHLPIGLAIFDRDRRLALFNPALGDLTGLSPTWLGARPTLCTVFERLRDLRILPEPKDYRGFRQQIADLEHGVATGAYAEDWALPDGRTFRVLGQPHPGGALALMVEDVSDEVALRRQVRSELALGQAVLDALEEGIAVFSAEGRLVAANTAYAGIWGDDPGAVLADLTAVEMLARWQQAVPDPPVWEQLRGFLGRPRDRGPWSARVQFPAGGTLRCRFVPLARGATLCAFRHMADAGAGTEGDAVRPLTTADQTG